jgi:hypothetical protein
MRVRRNAIAIPCFLTLLACGVQAQTTKPAPAKADSGPSAGTAIAPLHVAAGTVLIFHLQTRLHPNGDNRLDALPAGTTLHVKMLAPIDSATDKDGTEFQGVVASAVTSGNEIVVHPDAEVRGILALLRSKNHPDGFRYELFITRVTDQGKSYLLTASLDDSLFEPAAPASSATKTAVP